MALDQPGVVVDSAEVEQDAAQILGRGKGPHPEYVLFDGADEASAQQLPSGARTNAGELSMPREEWVAGGNDSESVRRKGVKMQGREAEFTAVVVAIALAATGDYVGRRDWLRISSAIAEVKRATPRSDELLH